MAQRHKNPHLRHHIAHIAARLLIDDSALDLERARRKAADRIGVADKRQWPSPAEILEVLSQEQRLFRPHQPRVLHNLRKQALAAMRHFSQFQPRLVGSVLDGSADSCSRVRLHLFANTPDEVLLALLEYGIPSEQYEYSLRYADGSRQAHPVFRFVAGEVAMELVVLPLNTYRNPPLNPVNERPDPGIDAGRLAQLLAIMSE